MKSEAEPFEPHKPLNDRGIAVGHSDVRNDTMIFLFRDEKFEFPTIQVYPHIARYNGYFYEAKIEDLRKLEAQSGG